VFLARKSQRKLTAFQAIDLAYSNQKNESDVVRVSAKIFWLPAPTEVRSREAIDLLLRERYGLIFEKEPPKWIAKYSLPAEGPIGQRIIDKEVEVAKLLEELEAERIRLAQASRFRKLLYEQGEDVLEPVVRDALRQLGAVVQEPQQRGREDGRLTDLNGRLGMLEVKGRTGDLRLSDVRELDQWVRDAVANENWNSKGILIANLHCDDEPSKRRNTIPKNCLDTARNFHICILTTTQIFRAILDDQNGKLERLKFWGEVFASNGSCNVPELD